MTRKPMIRKLVGNELKHKIKQPKKREIGSRITSFFKPAELKRIMLRLKSLTRELFTDPKKFFAIGGRTIIDKHGNIVGEMIPVYSPTKTAGVVATSTATFMLMLSPQVAFANPETNKFTLETQFSQRNSAASRLFDPTTTQNSIGPFLLTIESSKEISQTLSERLALENLFFRLNRQNRLVLTIGTRRTEETTRIKESIRTTRVRTSDPNTLLTDKSRVRDQTIREILESHFLDAAIGNKGLIGDWQIRSQFGLGLQLDSRRGSNFARSASRRRATRVLGSISAERKGLIVGASGQFSDSRVQRRRILDVFARFTRRNPSATKYLITTPNGRELESRSAKEAERFKQLGNSVVEFHGGESFLVEVGLTQEKIEDLVSFLRGRFDIGYLYPGRGSWRIGIARTERGRNELWLMPKNAIHGAGRIRILDNLSVVVDVDVGLKKPMENFTVGLNLELGSDLRNPVKARIPKSIKSNKKLQKKSRGYTILRKGRSGRLNKN